MAKKKKIILVIIIVLVVLLKMCTASGGDSKTAVKLSDYTYDEYIMYATMTKGYGMILDSLKSPKSAEFMGIGYNAEADVAYYCVLAENGFGGTVKSYIMYSPQNDSIYEHDDVKYDYDHADVFRTMDDLIIFMKAAKDADYTDVPPKTENEKMGQYTSAEKKMYEDILAGIENLNILYDDVSIVGCRYEKSTGSVYFYFMGEDITGMPVMTYASYSDRGGYEGDAYERLYNEAEMEVSMHEIRAYESAKEKDITR